MGSASNSRAELMNLLAHGQHALNRQDQDVARRLRQLLRCAGVEVARLPDDSRARTHDALDHRKHCTNVIGLRAPKTDDAIAHGLELRMKITGSTSPSSPLLSRVCNSASHRVYRRGNSLASNIRGIVSRIRS